MSPGNLRGSATMPVPTKLTVFFAVIDLAGAALFVTGILCPEPLRVWQAYLVNFLFWTGLSFGAVFFVAVLNLTGAKWGRPLKRLAEAFGAFLPVAFVLFFILYLGKSEIFPWIAEPVPGKQSWLNVRFLFVRNGAGLLLLTLISLAMIACSVRSDRQWSARTPEEGGTGGEKGPWERNWRRQQVLSPVLGIAYAFVLSLMAFDLVMSLDAQWCSTLLGGYFFIGSFYTGAAALCLLCLVSPGTLPGPATPRLLHDLGKLVLAFCLFTGYLFYAQFLTIWYGNVPAETRYVILRVKLTPWEPVAWAALFMIFLIPFFVLLGRPVKTRRLPMMILSLMILAGMWLERFILVAPSLWKGKDIPLGTTEALITAGYLGVVGLCLIAFLTRVPLQPVSDPLFRKWAEEKEERLSP